MIWIILAITAPVTAYFAWKLYEITQLTAEQYSEEPYKWK